MKQRRSPQDAGIGMQEWLKHIRGVSTRLNGIIAFLCPDCMTWEQAKKIDPDGDETHPGPYAKCRIVHELVGAARVDISFWGKDHLSATVSIHFDGGKIYGTNWGIDNTFLSVDTVAQKISTIHQYPMRVKRITDLVCPLAPLFTDDKLQWMVGLNALKELEWAAGVTPARSTARA